MSVHQPVREVDEPLLNNGAVSHGPPVVRVRDEGYVAQYSLQSSIVVNGEQSDNRLCSNTDSARHCIQPKDNPSTRGIIEVCVGSQNGSLIAEPVVNCCGNCLTVSHDGSDNLALQPNQTAAQSNDIHFSHELSSNTQCLLENQSEVPTHLKDLSMDNTSSSSSSHSIFTDTEGLSASEILSNGRRDSNRITMTGAIEQLKFNGQPSPNASPVHSARRKCKFDWIDLNVGGKVFKTTRLTLSKVPGSFLDCLCNNENLLSSHMDSSGAILIDREPEYWGPVLNWLRCGKLIVNDNVALEGVLEEASFCGLTALVTLLKERIRIRDTNIGGCSHVYRVLQCKEKELTQTVSTLTDGWKFEQLVNTGTCYSYGDEDQSEFLCVVSKKKVDQKGDDFLDQQAQNWQNRQSNLGRGAITNRN